jgi:hypothetical protein
MNILANIAKIQPQSYPSTLCHATLTFSVKKKKIFFSREKNLFTWSPVRLSGGSLERHEGPA